MCALLRVQEVIFSNVFEEQFCIDIQRTISPNKGRLMTQYLTESHVSNYGEQEETELRKKGYELTEKLIGKGSYSQVFKAFVRQSESWKPLACKVINKKFNKQTLDLALQRELNILKCISHKNIINLYETVELNKTYIFMELCPTDLLEYLQQQSALPERNAKLWFDQLSSALYYLHSKNIAHRDIKCENILITEDMTVKLADFGFATWCLGRNGEHRQSVNYCRSDAYASPELLALTPYYPKVADTWALGVVLYTMVNAVMPFHSNVKIQLKQQTRRSWRFHAKDLSPEVKVLIEGLLEPEIELRFSALEVRKSNWLKT